MRELYKLKATYVEEADTDSPDIEGTNELILEMSGICHDMGYIVLNTKRWAIDPDEKGINEFTDILKDFLKKAESKDKELTHE